MPPPTALAPGWGRKLNGKFYRVVRDKTNTPHWDTDEEAAILGKSAVESGEEKIWNTWHYGFGHRNEIQEGSYRYGKNVDTRFPRMILLGPKVEASSGAPANSGNNGVPSDFVEFNSKLYWWSLGLEKLYEIDLTPLSSTERLACAHGIR